MLARRFRMPYSAGLVLAGIALSLLPTLPPIRFSRELIFTVLLPPLIFEAALYIRWDELRKDYLLILVLASVGDDMQLSTKQQAALRRSLQFSA